MRNADNRQSLLAMQRTTSKALLMFLETKSKYKIKDLEKKTRKREIVFERQKFYYLCKINNICSLQLSGEYFNQDHSTAIHGHKTVSNLMETNKQVFAEMKTLDRLVKEFILEVKLFTWIEDDKTKIDEMFYKGKRVGYYDRNTNQYKIVCQQFYPVPHILEKDIRAFIETEFLKFLDCII
jgi:hypothetical protein